MAENVASGMEYLESKKCIHRLVKAPASSFSQSFLKSVMLMWWWSVCLYLLKLYAEQDMVHCLSCPGSEHSAHYCTFSQLGADHRSGLVEAVQAGTLQLKLPQMQQLRQNQTTTISQLLLMPVILEYDVFVCPPPIRFLTPFHPCPWCLSVFSKGIWQPETVWLQRITQWRSVILGCPVSMTMACIWQRVVSGRSPLNGRLLRPCTTVGTGCLPGSHSQGCSWPVPLPILPPAGVFRSLYHSEWRVELWYFAVGDFFPGSDTLHEHDQPADTRWGGER